MEEHAENSIIAFAKANAVTLIASVAALVTMALVPPDEAYAAYFDWRTICCLGSILAVVAALRHTGFFSTITRYLLRGFKTTRSAVAGLVAITGLISMFITNDLALIMMLPLAALLLQSAGHARLIPVTFVLQTLSANLLGMVMPFGNPQNLFLFSRFEIDPLAFLATMALPFALSAAALALCCLLLVKPQPIAAAKHAVQRSAAAVSEATASTTSVSAPEQPSPSAAAPTPAQPATSSIPAPSPARPAASSIPAPSPAALATSSIPAPSPAALATSTTAKNVLYAALFLLTFLFFFIFSGNLARMPEVQMAAAGLLQQNALVVSALASQVISNVPSAVLLAPFTENWAALLVGVNIGGAGTIVGSLASLITLNHYRALRDANSSSASNNAGPFSASASPSSTDTALPSASTALPSTGSYLKTFTILNCGFLILLLIACSLAGIR
ncbi:MAG: SLC13 family permease [Eggerthellaceae bacterium]